MNSKMVLSVSALKALPLPLLLLPLKELLGEAPVDGTPALYGETVHFCDEVPLFLNISSASLSLSISKESNRLTRVACDWSLDAIPSGVVDDDDAQELRGFLGGVSPEAAGSAEVRCSQLLRRY